MTTSSLNEIVIGYDASESARDALCLGRLLAGVSGARLSVAAVYRSDHLRAEAERKLASAREGLPYGSPASLLPVAGRSVADGLHRLAIDTHADLLVLGAGHRGQLALATSGDLADRLIQGAPCAVAVAPRGLQDDPDVGLRVIGIAYDGSPEAKRALELAARLALDGHATLRIIGVVEPASIALTAGAAFAGYPDANWHSRDWLYTELDEAAASVPADLRPQTILATGAADKEILRRAGVLDLLVVGSRGHGPIRRVLLGSVSAGLIRAAPCPVLVLPRGADTPALDETRAARLAAAG